MTILKPQHLNPGDTIGVVSPSYPYPTSTTGKYYQRFLKGKAELESMGFKVKLGKNLGKVKWWTGGTPKEKAEDINAMFNDNEVKAVIAHDGGNDSIRVLEFIDYDLVKRKPKPFLGFSNITNLHSAFFTMSGLVGFHMGLLTYELGWVWNDLQPQKKEQGRKYFRSILTSPNPLGKIDPITSWECWREGKASGKLFGGNLSILDSLTGSPYFPSVDQLKGYLFFWELDNSPSYRIERVLTHLKYLGLFRVISGMIVGKLVDMKRTAWEGLEEPSFKEIVLDNLKEFNFPILANVDFGHKTVQIPMPIGINARINSSKLVYELTESATI